MWIFCYSFVCENVKLLQAEANQTWGLMCKNPWVLGVKFERVFGAPGLNAVLNMASVTSSNWMVRFCIRKLKYYCQHSQLFEKDAFELS